MTPLSQEILENRKKLCHAIAALPKDASTEQVQSQLGPLLAEAVKAQAVDDHDHVEPINDGVTPLMVACDKAQLACLEYLANKRSDESDDKNLLIGSPLDTSSDDLCGGNSALHYAAASGCKGAIDVLTRILCDANTTSSQDNDEHTSFGGCLLSLTNLVNAHSDSFLMMAAAEGQTAFLQHYVQCFHDYMSQSSINREDASELVRVLFDERNDDDDSALLLACDHGHVAVVDYLIREVGVTTTDSDLQKAKETQKRLDKVLKRVSSKQQQEELQKRLRNVKHCVALLTVAMERKARKSMEELLLEEEKEHVSKKKKEPKKRKAWRIVKSEPAKSDNGNQKPSSDEESPERIDTDAEERSQGPEESSNESDQSNEEGTSNGEEDPSSVGDASPSRPMKTVVRDAIGADNRTVDAMMEALCVDSSMLLLTPHGMALNLSPAQLEVVETVLRRQLAALEQAREIQARLRVHSF